MCLFVLALIRDILLCLHIVILCLLVLVVLV